MQKWSSISHPHLPLPQPGLSLRITQRMFQRYKSQRPSPDQLGQNLWARARTLQCFFFFFKLPCIILMPSQGENIEPCQSVFPPPREYTPENELLIPVATSPWCPLLGLTHPQSVPVFFPIRYSSDALRMYQCLRNSLRELQVPDHGLQREQTPGGVVKAST